jgi:hypothetical protein
VEILRSQPDGSFERSGMRCDRCRIDYRFHRDLADLFTVQEFVRIDIDLASIRRTAVYAAMRPDSAATGIW